MITITKALAIVGQEAGKLGVERIDLADSIGRLLAEDIVADTDLPPFDRAQMDGYAVVAADTNSAPMRLKIVGESAAGRGWHKIMKRGQAVRIMTGAPVPAGADAVQKVELTRENNGCVEILAAVKKGNSIVKKGAEIKKSKKVISKGEVITANNIAVIAAFGYAKVKVAKRPRVAILATGSEIVDVGKKPKRDQIRNSNGLMLKALAETASAEVTILPTTGDDLSDLKNQIARACRLNVKSKKSAIRNPQSQILVVTGGVSVGKYDLTKQALTELGAEIFFERVNLKPGKPTVFARLGKTLIFGLPGNPVSAAVTFYLFVRTAILQMQNMSQPQLKQGFAILANDAKAAKDRDTFLPSRLETNKSGQLIATPLKSQGSSDFVGFARADSLIFIAAGKSYKLGDTVELAFLD